MATKTLYLIFVFAAFFSACTRAGFKNQASADGQANYDINNSAIADGGSRIDLLLNDVLIIKDAAKDNDIGQQVVGAKDLGLKDVGLKDLVLKDVGLKDIGLKDVGLKDIGLKDRGLKDVGLKDVGLKDIGLKDIGLKDVGLKDVGLKDVGLKDAAIIPGSWVTLSAGTFIMGSPASEPCRSTNESQHQVTLTQAFSIQTTEVTQQQFQTIMGYNPSNFSSCGSTCPVEKVSWYEAAAYCNALSANAGYAKCYDCGGSGTSVTCSPNSSYQNSNIYNCPGYRLPTEAEWEYSYRAGTTTAYHNNTGLTILNCSSTNPNASEISWNNTNSSSTTHASGGKKVNNWGLYDMAGNVWEWANDTTDGSTDYGTASVTNPAGLTSQAQRVLRGGSFSSDPFQVRAARRGSGYPYNNTANNFGFRCARSL